MPTKYRVAGMPFYRTLSNKTRINHNADEAQVGDIFIVNDEIEVDRVGDLYGRIERTGQETYIAMNALALERAAAEGDDDCVSTEALLTVTATLYGEESDELGAVIKIIALARLLP